jgi:carbon storage regulator CsrA
MLVLTRKFQQQIKIGDQITVTILRVKGQTVRVGIDAPREVRVVRGELPPEDQKAADRAAEQVSADIDVAACSDKAEAGMGEKVAALRGPAALAARLPSRKRSARLSVPPLRVVRSAPSAVLAK